MQAVPQQGGDRQREFKKSSYRFVLLRENILLNKHVVTDKPQANQTNKPHEQREQIWARAYHPSERDHAQYIRESIHKRALAFNQYGPGSIS